MILVITDKSSVCESIAIRIDRLAEFRCRYTPKGEDGEFSASDSNQIEYVYMGSGDRMVEDITEDCHIAIMGPEKSHYEFDVRDMHGLHETICEYMSKLPSNQ